MALELMIATAKTFSEDNILRGVLESVREYRLSKSKDSKNKMMVHLTLAYIKFGTEDMSIQDTLNYIDKEEKAINFFESGKQ